MNTDGSEMWDDATSLDALLTRLSASPWYRDYLRIRAELLRRLPSERSMTPSSYWTEELAFIDYLFDASPLVVRHLRWHTHYITGVRPYEYRSNAEATAWLGPKLKALHELGNRDLFVPEAAVLGGFGRSVEGALVNTDTLKYYEVLIALERFGVVARLRDAEEPVVWEIGAGWGGLAYYIKTLFPAVRYVVTDMAGVSLFAATYLAAALPNCDISFDPEAAGTADFTFLGPPDGPRCDVQLTVNTVSFQEMTTAQVRHYVGLAHDRGSSLYSLNRDRSVYNRELTSVRDLMSERYAIELLSLLPVSYERPLPASTLAKLRNRVGRLRSGNPYRHVFGQM